MATLVPAKSLSLLGGAVLAALLVPVTVAAQLSWGGQPASLRVALTKSVPTVAMEPVNVAEYLAEDADAPKDRPFRFGATLPVDLGLQNAGAWETLGNGDRVWRLRISSPGAYTLSALFSSFRLPAGASLFVYNDDHSHTLGSYDERNVKEDGEFSFEPVAGDAMTLEYYEPAVVTGRGELRLSAVIHDYRDILTLLDSKVGPGDASGACEVDVKCPQGAPWQSQQRAVTVLLIGGSACSGALLNNTANDGTRYYMSAYHCGSLNNAVFRFNYEKPNCGSGTAPTNHTVQGSTQMAGNQSLDFRLVKITSAIPTAYSPYYLGWDRSATAIPTNTLTIHHPQIDVKKISFDNNPPSKSGVQWHIAQWDLGVTEPGSSGCPLMNQNGRFIGQLYGGQATCSFVFNDYYGRFDQAWPSVAAFLDPGSTGAAAINGFDPAQQGTPPVLSTVGPGSVQAFQGGTITLTGSGFTGATMVTTGATQLVVPGFDFTIVNDTQITYQAPIASALGSTNVTVTGPGGTSAAKTFNYIETNPPKLAASAFAQTGLGFTWTWGGGSADNSYLIAATTNATFMFSGFPILANFTILSTQTLSAVGIGSLGMTIPAGLLGVTFYSEVATFDGVTNAFVGASNITSTIIL